MRRDLTLASAWMLLLAISFYPVYAQTVVLTVPPRYAYDAWFNLSSGNEVDYSFSVTSWRGVDEINFQITDFAGSIVFLYVGRVGEYSGSFVAPSTGIYTLRFDNSFSFITTKYVALTYSVASEGEVETTGSSQAVSHFEPTSYFPQTTMLMLWTSVFVVFFIGILVAICGLVMGRRRSMLRSQPYVSHESRSIEWSPRADDSSASPHIVQKRSLSYYAAASLISMGGLTVVYCVAEILSNSLFQEQLGVWNWSLYFAANPFVSTALQIAPMLIFFGVGLWIVASRGTQNVHNPRLEAPKEKEHCQKMQITEVLPEPIQSNRKCAHCGAEVPLERAICGKCQMPA